MFAAYLYQISKIVTGSEKCKVTNKLGWTPMSTIATLRIYLLGMVESQGGRYCFR